MEIGKNIGLGVWSSWRVGGRADFFCVPETEADVLYALNWAKERYIGVSFLGGGTNILISDKGVRGLVIHTRLLNRVVSRKEAGRFYISALAGVSKAEVMKAFAKHQLAPALFLCGLPGSVAAGVVMNAGVSKAGFGVQDRDHVSEDIFPYEFRDIVDAVKVLRSGEIIEIKKEELEWRYRGCRGWEPGMIYEVSMSWRDRPLDNFSDILKKTALRRVRTQPLQSLSCGSVFKNPAGGKKAGWLIEQCGLKGYQIGGAVVSEKHANFIVNKGGAKARDIHQLIQHIKKTVKTKMGIILTPEVRYFGHWPT